MPPPSSAYLAAYPLAGLLLLLGTVWVIFLFREHRLADRKSLLRVALYALPASAAALLVLWTARSFLASYLP